jgi:ATP-dependent Lon protease
MAITKTETISKGKYNLRDKKNRLKKKIDSDEEIELFDDEDVDDDDYESDYSTEDPDDDDDDDSSEDEIYQTEEEDEEEEKEEEAEKLSKKKKEEKKAKKDFDFKNYLSKIFPSKYMDEKVNHIKKQSDKEYKMKKNGKDTEKSEETKVKKNPKELKQSIKESKELSKESSKEKDSAKDSKKSSFKYSKLKEDSEKESHKKENKSSSKVTKNKKHKEESSESDSSEEEEEYEEEESNSDDEDSVSDDSDSDDSEKKEKPKEKTKEKTNDKVNIILNITGDDDYDDDDFEDECLLYENEDENEECGSDDEKTFMKENYHNVAIPTDIMNHKKSKKDKKDKKKNKSKQEEEEKEKENEIPMNREAEYLELNDLKKHLIEKLHKKPTSKILLKTYEKCQKEINKLVKSARFENTKKYHKLIHSERKKTNEIEYFKKKLSNKEQMTIMNDLKEINKHINIDKPYRLTLLQSKMPANLKAVAMQKLNLLSSMDPIDPEYYKIKNWVDTFMKIPFGVYKSLSIKMDDGLDLCNDYIVNAKKTLDDCVYGLDDAKMQIMQLLGQWIANPSALGTAIAIKGPMGTGKTTIVKEGISKILGREFEFIALGGAGDSSFLEGHSYTYEGSTWGKIVQILIDSKCMNPVIYFDELDKISDTPRGQEIIGILTHLTDTSQNSQFHDKYFSEIDFDLSKCLFIFSYNDESLVNPILKDRMYRIQTKGYDSKEKIVIARNYLLPKIREQVNFNETDIIITDDIIQYIVQNEGFTKKEDGVRNLKRCLEIIYTKLNLFRLVKPEINLFGKQLDLEVSFPFTVTRKVVDVLIKNDEEQKQSLLAMYV